MIRLSPAPASAKPVPAGSSREAGARFQAVSLLLALLSWSACAPEDLDVAYLYVPGFEVEIDGVTEPSAITDVRVVLGSENLGFYPLPARIPILGTGTRRVRLEPAVQRSGMSAERVVYDLYTAFEAELPLRLGQTDTIRPTVTYSPATTVAFEERFEGPSTALTFDLVPGGSAPLTLVGGDSARAGASSGRIDFSRERPVYEVASFALMGIPADATQVWLEVDYRGSVPLVVGLVEPTPSPLPEGFPRQARYAVGARVREDWQKFYFDIIDPLNRDFVGAGFRVALLAEVAPDSAAGRQVFVDNLRVAYR